MAIVEFSNPVSTTGIQSTLTPAARVAAIGNMQSLFSNNASVFYKKHSLASGGVGTVRNRFAKARRT